MGYRTKRGALYGWDEVVFGDGGAGGGTYIPVEEVDFSDLGYGYQEGEDITQSDVEDQGLPIRQPAKLSFRMGLHPYQSTAPEAAPTGNPHPPAWLMGKMLGGIDKGGWCHVVTAGSTASLVKVTEGQSASLAVGQPIWCTSAAGQIMMGRVKSIALSAGFPDEITLTQPMPAAPDAGTDVFGSHYVWKGTPTGSHAFGWAGEAATDFRKGLGSMASSCKLTANPRVGATLAWEYMMARVSDMTDGESGGAPADETYAFPEKGQTLDGGLYLWDGATSTKITGGVEIDFGVETVPNDGINWADPNGIAEYLLLRSRLRIKLVPAYDGNELMTMFRNSTTLSLSGWWGVGYKKFGFCIPAAIQVQHPKPGDRNGLQGLELLIGAATYSGDTGADDPTNAPAVFGWLAGDAVL